MDTKTQLTIPLIDVSGLFSDDPTLHQEVALALRLACEQRGFFYIRGHGVPTELTDAMFTVAQSFFAQPMDAKMRVDKKKSICNRGYEPLRAQTLEVGAPPDLKESYYIGREIPANDPRVLAGQFNTGPNLWPEDLPGFRATLESYFIAAQDLSEKLVKALALSLGLPESHFDNYLKDPAGTLRILHYPPQPGNPSPGEKGCGAHTDFGALTLLLQDENGGLQVWDAATEGWIDAPPIPGTYVVNIGDLFARWTNGRYHSTLHRVINVSGKKRHSVPFFFTGNMGHIVECLPTCRVPDEEPKFPAVTVEQHLRDCYGRTYV